MLQLFLAPPPFVAKRRIPAGSTYVSKSARVGSARCIAARIGRPQVRRYIPVSEDVAQRHLILDDFCFSRLGCEFAQIRVRPGVRCQLVAGADYSLNHSVPSVLGLIDGAFSNVVSGNKKSRLHVVFFENV